jgi:alginate O-acetyltransferase complex protein AlgI
MATMVLGGLWHGASWTFALWGLIHGTLLIAYHRYGSLWDRLPIVAQRVGTFLLVALAWIPFRATSFHQWRVWTASLFGASGLRGVLEPREAAKALVITGVGLFIANAFSPASKRADFASWGPLRQLALGACTVVAVLWMTQSSRFLYFQF